jgi:AcrR family transcriptional regulator
MGLGEPPARARAKAGRPRRAMAGEVETRILDAAREVFLERGFEAASIDEIAEVARAGKPTIYARYASKEALFTAVVLRAAAATLRFDEIKPAGVTTEERLAHLGGAILSRALWPESVGLFRSVIAEARRLPELASNTGRAARERAIEAVAKLFGEFELAEETEMLPAFAPDRVAKTARMFMELIFMPLVMRALFGESLEALRAEIPEHVAARVTFFLAACRGEGVQV